MHAGKVAFRNG